MKLGDLETALALDSQRALTLDRLKRIDTGKLRLLIDSEVCDDSGLIEVATAPLRHALAMWLAVNTIELRKIGVEPG